MNVDLGFVEKCEAWSLESRFFPSKIGGKPAWLDLKNIPGKTELECNYCFDPCIFLCQVYAPYENEDKAFHRTIYIFVCKNVKCCKENQNGNFKVFRSQLEKNNLFYPSEPPEERKDWRTDLDVNSWTTTCCICGIYAPSHCAKCKIKNYCCRLHQVYDWINGHKKTCGTDISVNTSFLFPEYELVIEKDEDVENDDDDLEKEKAELEKFQCMVLDGQAGTMQNDDVDPDLLKMSSIEEDEVFAEFHVKTNNYPDQVLRYQRGGPVLYISQENQALEIPNCTQCNGERQFEFQIMPQLLNFLNFDDSAESLDWGILVIFTCKESCIPKKGYTVEYIWKQDIVNK
ncbi:programmed cell death protein 2 [Prorops nasuta]|uniref:programmed cell death protein 2 n=1 Tax=Prorops nasuta TaxID=863751 RepID=UPI0034CECFB1